MNKLAIRYLLLSLTVTGLLILFNGCGKNGGLPTGVDVNHNVKLTGLPTPGPNSSPTPTPAGNSGEAWPAGYEPTKICKEMGNGTQTGDAGCNENNNNREVVAAMDAAVEAARYQDGMENDLVVDYKKYQANISQALERQGYCAYPSDLNDEMTIKKKGSNDISWQYKVEGAGGRWYKKGNGSCEPAKKYTATQFAYSDLADPGCTMPSSPGARFCVPGHPLGSQFLPVVRDQVYYEIIKEDMDRVNAEPSLPAEVLNVPKGKDPNPSGAYSIINREKYYKKIIDKLHAKGYCASMGSHDELSIKSKNSGNVFSTYFRMDISASPTNPQGDSKAGYMSTCFESTF